MNVEFFTFASGAWAREDVYRWQAWGTSKGSAEFAAVPAGLPLHVGGWNTVKLSLARGFGLSHDSSDSIGDYEASAK